MSIDQTPSSSLPRCLAPPPARSKESSATLDRPSIRVGTLVCQAPHAMHALCVLCGSLVGQGAPISKSVCECFTQPWCGRLCLGVRRSALSSSLIKQFAPLAWHPRELSLLRHS